MLKWADINEDSKSKKVYDISLTQDRLINGLIRRIDKNQHYLLDGHYCLLDKDNNIRKIPYTTFEKINPISLHIILGKVSEIKSRLELRDSHFYDSSLLEDMQNEELSYAQELSNHLSVNSSIGSAKDSNDIIAVLRKILMK